MKTYKNDGMLVLQSISQEIEGDLSRIDFDRNKEHISRHLPGSGCAGSKFTQVETVAEIIDLVTASLAGAFQMARMGLYVETMSDVHVTFVKIAIDVAGMIGTKTVVQRNSLPVDVTIEAVLRGPSKEDQHVVLVTKDVAPQETRKLVIDLRRADGRWYLHSAYPGILTPDFSDRAFWQQHVFLEG